LVFQEFGRWRICRQCHATFLTIFQFGVYYRGTLRVLIIDTPLPEIFVSISADRAEQLWKISRSLKRFGKEKRQSFQERRLSIVVLTDNQIDAL
jgi:hypothetical protein